MRSGLVRLGAIAVFVLPRPGIASDGDGAAGTLLVLFAVALAAYFLPTIVAVTRHHNNVPAIFSSTFSWAGP
jgi:hypothetical protein